MLGMEGAGKTHMLYTRLVGEAGMNTIKEKCSKDESERYPQPTIGYNYEIVEYVQHLTYWSVRVVLKVEGSLMNNMRSDRNPLGLYPTPDWEKQLKRQYKLDRLL